MSFLHNGITAHRGNSADYPENTRPAFVDAIACGADWIELDAHLTSDGHVVVCHDATTGRTADRDLRIADTTFAELRTLDMSWGFRATRGPDGRQHPAPIPLLSEVLGLAMAQRRTRVSIQPKADCVAEIVRVIRDLGAEAWVGFNDGDEQKLRTVRKLLLEACVFYDTSPAMTSVGPYIQTAVDAGFHAVVMHHSTVTPARANAVRAAGLEPGAWTVNDPQTMQEMLSAGVERLYTDCPRVLGGLLSERARDDRH